MLLKIVIANAKSNSILNFATERRGCVEYAVAVRIGTVKDAVASKVRRMAIKITQLA